jgi:hypothetical protein
VRGAGTAHAPAPSQNAAGVSVLPAQLWGRQPVALPGNVQAVREAAAHEPAHAPLPPQAARAPCGAPEITGAQWPGAAAVSHASQLPVQAPSQQTPSTHRLDPHSPPPAQGDPSGFGPHEPAVQLLPGVQSFDDVHEPRQPAPPLAHRYGAQVAVEPGTHDPAPLHLDSGVSVLVAESQLAGAHTTLFQSRQAPRPSHLPSVRQPPCGVAAQPG